MAKMKERNVGGPTQNVHMITVEQRPCGPAINVFTRSGAMKTPQDKGKAIDRAWVRQAPEKVPTFDAKREKEVFMEAKKDFTDLGVGPSIVQQH